MKFILWLAALFLPLATYAGEVELGRHYGLLGGTSIIVDLRETTNTVREYAGTSLRPREGMVLSFGAAREIYHSNPAQGEYGMMDPNSPAIRVLQRAQLEKATSIGSGSWRYGLVHSGWRPGVRVRYFADPQHHLEYEGIFQKDMLGRTHVEFTFKYWF